MYCRSFMIVIRGWVNIQENANSLEKAEIKQIIKKELRQ